MISINKFYRCFWPEEEPELVQVTSLLKNNTWAKIVWMEKRATMSPKLVDVQMNDVVPVDWLYEIDSDGPIGDVC